MDELDWVAHVERRFGNSHAAAEIGIGDDAAVLASGVDGRVVSVDAAVEGVHFERGWAAPEVLSHRAYVASLSDLAAMGARPVAGFFSVVSPPNEDPAWLRGAIDGVATAAQRYGAPILGGNFANGAVAMWNFTVIGALVGPAVRRSGAQVGDGVFVTGTVGGAALGWRVLQQGGAAHAGEAKAVDRWCHPRPRFDVVGELAREATAAIDVSDGLSQDLGHIARASGVSLEIEVDRIPLDPGFGAAAEARGQDPLQLALCGGEDYEIAFTAPLDAAAASVGQLIGRVHARGDDDVIVRNADGTRRPAPAGHRHLAV